MLRIRSNYGTTPAGAKSDTASQIDVVAVSSQIAMEAAPPGAPPPDNPQFGPDWPQFGTQTLGTKKEVPSLQVWNELNDTQRKGKVNWVKSFTLILLPNPATKKWGVSCKCNSCGLVLTVSNLCRTQIRHYGVITVGPPPTTA
jgi:hypothetical protein